MSLEMFNMFCSLRNAMGNGTHLKNPAVRAGTRMEKAKTISMVQAMAIIILHKRENIAHSIIFVKCQHRWPSSVNIVSLSTLAQ